jgi:hypothetical protein
LEQFFDRFLALENRLYASIKSSKISKERLHGSESESGTIKARDYRLTFAEKQVFRRLPDWKADQASPQSRI